MSEMEDRDARPYLRALNEQVSDLMAEHGIPQGFWPAQVIVSSARQIGDGDDD